MRAASSMGLMVSRLVGEALHQVWASGSPGLLVRAASSMGLMVSRLVGEALHQVWASGSSGLLVRHCIKYGPHGLQACW